LKIRRIGKKFANLPQITWGELKLDCREQCIGGSGNWVVDLRSTDSSDDSGIWCRSGLPHSAADARLEPRKCGSFREARAGEKLVATLSSLVSDLILDGRVENEREVGGIYRGLRGVDFQICPR